MRFRFIEQHADTWPVRLMCRVLEVSASGYYGWRSRPESARSTANQRLLEDIRRIHAGHHGRYGSPRVHAVLRAEGRSTSRGRVERLMRLHGIRALAGRRFRPCTTDSRHDLPIAPNLLKQEFSASRPNRIWLADPKGSAKLQYHVSADRRGPALLGCRARSPRLSRSGLLDRGDSVRDQAHPPAPTTNGRCGDIARLP